MSTEEAVQNLEVQLRCVVIDAHNYQLPMHTVVNALKRTFIEAELWRHKNHQIRASEALGVHRNTLGRAIKDLGVRTKFKRGRPKP